MNDNNMKEITVSSLARILEQSLGDKIIAYRASLAKALKSVNAALVLQQCIYWSKRTRDLNGWFYKTIGDFNEELALSRCQQDTAINILLKHKLIKKRKKGIPPKRYFKINIKCIVEFLNRYLVNNDLSNSSQKQLGEEQRSQNVKRETDKLL